MIDVATMRTATTTTAAVVWAAFLLVSLLLPPVSSLCQSWSPPPRRPATVSFAIRGVATKRGLVSLLKMSSSSSSPSSSAQASSDLRIKDFLTAKCPTIRLRNGMEHPFIGFGTYKVGVIPASASSAVAVQSTTAAAAASSSSEELLQRTASECVADALDVGYRFLECAEFYANEAQVGDAIAKSCIARKDLFLCSKVWTTTMEQGPAAMRAQLQRTLSDLQTSYLDLYLIHWPVPGHHVAAYQTLLEFRKEGLIRGVGVSNYAWEDYVELKEALAVGENSSVEDDLPLVNQIEINPFLYRKNTIEKFRQEGVVLQSYRSLRDGKAFDNVVLLEIAKTHQKPVASILGRWCIQHELVYMPKSMKKERMVENANVFDFELSDQEMERLDNLTTSDNLQAFQTLYRKCVNRDTSKDGSMEGVKMAITID